MSACNETDHSIFSIDPESEKRARESILTFLTSQSAKTKIALVTSGGTTVPLEQKTVRFIDNFSTGSRGAELTENLLLNGYAVIFLSRRGSLYPFVRSLNSGDSDVVLRDLASDPSEYMKRTKDLASTISSATDNGKRLLNIGFTSINEYISLLKICCEMISNVESRAMVILAAAVSDFYIPYDEMSKDKIQSSNDGLSISLKNVPKMLGFIKRAWSPFAMVVSFKLETNENVLLAKAAGSLKNYKTDIVVANNLIDYKKRAILVSVANKDSYPLILAESVQGNETIPIVVENINTVQIKTSPDVPASGNINKDLSNVLVAQHAEFIENAPPSANKRRKQASE